MQKLSEQEILDCLWAKNSTPLCTLADTARQLNVGQEVHLRALIEFSNICAQNCLYCGLRADNANIERFKMSPKEILEMAKKSAGVGYKTIVLQSGESDTYPIEILAELISDIKKLDVDITLSLGEKSFDFYKTLKQAGASRYLLRIETVDEELYKIMRPQNTLASRKRCLEDLKNLGYEVGSGLLVGLPNQTVKSIAQGLIYLAEIQVDMAGIGPFIAHPQTPLASETQNNFDLALRAMAVMRLLLPNINIPATTAMETARVGGREIALKSGANVLMINVNEAAQNYQIYPGKPLAKDISLGRKEAEDFINGLGRTVATTIGKSPAYLRRITK